MNHDAFFDSIDPTELKAFVAQYAQFNPAFKNALIIRFADLLPDDNLSVYRSALQQVNAHFRSSIDNHQYGPPYEISQLEQFCYDMVEEGERQLKLGRLNSAFNLATTVIEKICAEYLEHLHDEDFRPAFDQALILVEDVACAEVPDALAKTMLQYVQDVFNNKTPTGAFEAYDFANAVLPLCESNREYALTMIDILEQQADESETAPMLFKIRLATFGSDHAKEHTEDHMSDSPVRVLLIDHHLQSGDFEEARSLIVESLEEQPDSGFWNEKLRHLEIAEGNIDEALALSTSMLKRRVYTSADNLLDFIRDNSTPEQYHDVLDQLITQDIHLAEDFYNSHYVFNLLIRAERWETMLELSVGKRLQSLLQYESYLQPRFPDEYGELYVIALMSYGDDASKRSAYQNVAWHLTRLYDLKYRKQAQHLAQYFLRTYPRKPALQHEIGQVLDHLSIT